MLNRPCIVVSRFTVTVASGTSIMMLAAMERVTTQAGIGPPLSRTMPVRPLKRAKDQKPSVARLYEWTGRLMTFGMKK